MLNDTTRPVGIMIQPRSWLTLLLIIVFQLPGFALAAGAKIPKEIVYSSSVGEVRFPHRAHIKQKCVTCHHQIHAEALDTPHDDYLDSSWIHCRTCHDPDTELSGKYYKCSECHHSTPENIADETLSAKVVIHEICWSCHEAGTGVEASESCGDCHVKNLMAEITPPGEEGERSQ